MKHVVSKKGKISFRKYGIFSIIILLVLFSSLTINNFMKGPGDYDEFAKCLTEKDVIVYGNDFCSYTTNQLGYFGKSKKFLNYVKCVNNEELCDEKNIEVTPTWEIDGKTYPQVQTFEKLSILSGCEI